MNFFVFYADNNNENKERRIDMDKKKKDDKKKLEITPMFDDPVNKEGDIPIDVLGSYSGMSLDGSRPVQDADDL